MNVPNCNFPEPFRILRLYSHSPRLANREKPKRSIEPKRIEKVRVKTQLDKNGTWIYPEFYYEGEWIRFYGPKALMTYVAKLSVGMTDRINKVSQEWKHWLETWRSKQILKIKIEENPKEPRELPVKKKKDRKSCDICGKVGFMLHRVPETKSRACNFCLDELARAAASKK